MRGLGGWAEVEGFPSRSLTYSCSKHMPCQQFCQQFCQHILCTETHFHACSHACSQMSKPSLFNMPPKVMSASYIDAMTGNDDLNMLKERWVRCGKGKSRLPVAYLMPFLFIGGHFQGFCNVVRCAQCLQCLLASRSHRPLQTPLAILGAPTGALITGRMIVFIFGFLFVLFRLACCQSLLPLCCCLLLQYCVLLPLCCCQLLLLLDDDTQACCAKEPDEAVSVLQ